MKNSIKSLIRALAIIVIIFAMNISYGQTTSVTFNCNASGLVPGAIIDVPVVFTSPDSLIGQWQVVFYYNRDVLTYSSCTFDPIWNGLAPGVNSNFTSPSSPQYPGQVYTKVSWGNISGTAAACNPRTAFTLHFVYNGGTTSLEIINKSTSTTQSQGYFSFLRTPKTVNVNVNWSTPSILDGPKVPIYSVAKGGLWKSPLTWNPSNVPSASTNTEIYITDTAVVVDTNLTVANNVTINSGAQLTVNSGKNFAVFGTFTIKNGASYVNKGSSNNSAIVERIIAKDNSWHFLASPVDGAAIKPYFAPTTADITFDFYKWDEAESTALPGVPWTNIRNTLGAYASGFDNFEIGRGYLVAYSMFYTGSATHTFVGTLGNGDKTITINYSLNHNNLIGNPYPSAIDWDNATLNTNRTATLGINPYISIWNESVGNYGVYVGGIGTNGVSNVIAPHQAFFVQAHAAGSLTIPNASRVHPGTQAFLKSTSKDLLKLKVSSTANSYSDEMIVKFDENSNGAEGVSKWFSLITESPSLYSIKNNAYLSINTLTSVNSNQVVAVGFKAGINATYSIKASELNSFSTTTYVYLKDLKTNIITNLNEKMYTFAATTSDNTDRFELIFALSPLGISNTVIDNTSIYSYDNTIYINSNENLKQIAIYNTLGQLIKSIENKSGLISVNMNGNSTAYYIVKIVTDKNVYSEKVFVK